MRQPIRGNGMWVWQTKETAKGSHERLSETAQALGLGHVLFKVLDGADRRLGDVSFVRKVKPLLDAAGIQTVPWGYWYANDPASVHAATPEAAAKASVGLCAELGLSAFVVNAEREMKKTGMAEQARAFCLAFRAAAAEAGLDLTLGLSTFARPALHPEFPYGGWLGGPEPIDCDVVLPQCYGGDPVGQARRAVQELAEYGEPVIVTGRAYLGDGIDNPARVAQDVARMSEWSKETGTALNWWVWQAAEKLPAVWSVLEALAPAKAVPPLASPSNALSPLIDADRQRIAKRLRDLAAEIEVGS